MMSRTLTFFTICLAAAPSAYAQEAAEQSEAPAVQTPQNTAQTSYVWNICNETSFILRAAYGLSDQGAVTVRGWTEIIPGACHETTYTDPDTPRFLYAESLPIHRGGIREWKGKIELCAKEEDFSSEASEDCALNNLETREYLAVKPSESRTTLIEPSDFGPKAETAALQRLLRDAGYDITKIDGLPGRRTNRYIRDFKKKYELDKNIKGAELIAALKEVASLTVATIGVELCNDSSATIWGAIATREEGSWQSKGWWELEPGLCQQLYTQSLQGKDAHYYALQENIDPEDPEAIRPDNRLRSVTATPAQFCIAESRFSAMGRDFCTEGGYVAANFRPIVTDQDGVKITLGDSDFAEVSAAGLRR